MQLTNEKQKLNKHEQEINNSNSTIQFNITNKIKRKRNAYIIHIRNAKKKHKKWKKFGRHTFQTIQNFRLSAMKNHIFKDAPIIFLYFLKHFGNKYGVRGS